MASVPETTKYSPPLHEAGDKRWKALGYRTKADYRRGLARFDLLVQGLHPVTLAISQMPLDEQDRIDAELLELTKKGVGNRGELFAHIITDIVKLGKEPTGSAIAEVIRRASGTKRRPQGTP